MAKVSATNSGNTREASAYTYDSAFAIITTEETLADKLTEIFIFAKTEQAGIQTLTG